MPSTESEDCPICQVSIENGGCETRCGHSFHLDCLVDWLKDHDTCPMCRASVGTRRASDTQLRRRYTNRSMSYHIDTNREIAREIDSEMSLYPNRNSSFGDLNLYKNIIHDSVDSILSWYRNPWAMAFYLMILMILMSIITLVALNVYLIHEQRNAPNSGMCGNIRQLKTL